MEDENGAVPALSQSFPDEMVVDILRRLPVKSLLRFMSVSKSWFCLISNPDFIKYHRETAAAISNYALNRLVCVYSHPGNHFSEYSLRLMVDEPGVDPILYDYAVGDSTLKMRIVGSCEGMVCIAFGEDHFVLWNPSIRKYNCTPCLHIIGGYGCYVKDGFGYVEPTDDYKVVLISYRVFYSGHFPVHIYSMKSNQWRRIEDFSLSVPVDNSGKYACGKLHWLSESDGCLEIISLDLTTESYGRLPAPHDRCTSSATNSGNNIPCMSLGLFSGKLCVLYDDHRAHMDLWVMNEYGVVNSWTRTIRFPHMDVDDFFPHMLRLWSLKKGLILVFYGNSVVIYNSRYRSWIDPGIQNSGLVHQADVFVESLVSPFEE